MKVDTKFSARERELLDMARRNGVQMAKATFTISNAALMQRNFPGEEALRQMKRDAHNSLAGLVEQEADRLNAWESSETINGIECSLGLYCMTIGQLANLLERAYKMGRIGE